MENRREYFFSTENEDYKVTIKGVNKEYPGLVLHILNGGRWKTDFIANDDIWDVLGVKTMDILKTDYEEHNVSGYNIITSDKRLIVFERFLLNEGFMIEKGNDFIIKKK